MLALLLTAGLIAVGGMVVMLAPGSGVGASSSYAVPAGPGRSAQSPAELVHRQEIEERFSQAVVMLHAKQYERAVTALHRVLELAPRLPEAHVNMGFAMLGLERFDAARDFFDAATALNPTQANAYYGLALALEGKGDLELAVGAMRSYLHLARNESEAHLRRARSALWEWEAHRDAARAQAPPQGAAKAVRP